MLVAWYWGELVLTFVGNGSNGRRESDFEDDSGFSADLGFGAISRNLILTCVRQSDIGNSLNTLRRLRPTIMYLLSSCRAPRRHVRLSSITPHNRTYDDLKIELSNLDRRTVHLACRHFRNESNSSPNNAPMDLNPLSLSPARIPGTINIPSDLNPLSSSRTRIPGTISHNIRKRARHIRKPGMINEALSLLLETRLRTLR
jgi:hypothetical protein